MTLQEASIEQLKASAYDILVQIEQHQNNLRVINAEISKRNPQMEETVETTEEVVTEEVTTTEAE